MTINTVFLVLYFILIFYIVHKKNTESYIDVFNAPCLFRYIVLRITLFLNHIKSNKMTINTVFLVLYFILIFYIVHKKNTESYIDTIIVFSTRWKESRLNGV